MNIDTFIGIVAGIFILIAVILAWEKAVHFFSPAEKEKRRQLKEKIAEQHRLYDEEQARRDMEEELFSSDAEVDWRKEGVM